jgi:hypothetical protein
MFGLNYLQTDPTQYVIHISMLQLLAMQSAEPRLMVTMALKQLAENANKIGQLNISPDLLETLISSPNH